MAPSYEDLPEEIWDLILNRLGEHRHSEFESLSLVSKRFLLLTDRLRHRLTVVDQTYFLYGTLSRFIHRFKHLKTLDLSKLNQLNLEIALHEIARSSVALNLEVLDISNHESIPIVSLEKLGLSNRKLKVLKCANVIKIRDGDLIAIAESHPDLEELDISYPRHKFTVAAFRDYNISDLLITDDGIEGLSSGLKNLVKLNISMNHLLTDKSLTFLSSNCLRLEEVAFVDCIFITMEGVRFMVHNSPNLRTISMTLNSHLHGTSTLFMDPDTSGKGLSGLHFKKSDISDLFLNSIAKCHIPLKSLSLSCCNDYTIDGITSLVSAYPSLEFLDLSRSDCFSDNFILDLSQYLHDLVSVKLNYCCNLTSTSLFTLINNCPFLKDIEMKNTNLGVEDDSTIDVVGHPNPSIKSLNLSGNTYLTTECLVKIALACPNLEWLDVSSCAGLRGSLGEILRGCVEIKRLSISDCKKVMNIGLDMKPLKLKKLYMARSGVNDEGLVEVGLKCNELVKINLSACQHVTTSSVKYIVKHCKKLREINVLGCPNLHVFIVYWMVSTRPSLRKLVPPSYAVTTESQRQHMLQLGCQVTDR